MERAKSVREHVRALGFENAEQYQRWCGSNNLSTSLHKSVAQRSKEVGLRHRQHFETDLSTARHRMRRVENTIEDLAAGRIDRSGITHPGLSRVADLLAGLKHNSDICRSFVRLLQGVLPKADFLDMSPVIPQFGRAAGNTYVDGLFACSHHHKLWVGSPDGWHPPQRNLRRNFGDLLRHLFARYDVPSFMDSAWFLGCGTDAVTQQGWFIHLGYGQNIRTAELPLSLTKAMAHLFVDAPASFTVYQALRWGQILALDGPEELVHRVNATRLGEGFEHEDFWVSVIHFFVNNPMLDYDYVGPIVDYIQYRRFEEREVLGQDGIARTVGPPDPSFSMKGRRAEPLLALVDDWHRQLAREEKSPYLSWAASGIQGFDRQEEDDATGRLCRWTITELLTRTAVIAEGKEMHHCVGSYALACAKGNKSVWSMKVEDVETGIKRSVMTISVKHASMTVEQARGKCNAMPGTRPPSNQAARVLRNDGDLLVRGREIMRIWGRKQGISVPRYT